MNQKLYHTLRILTFLTSIFVLSASPASEIGCLNLLERALIPETPVYLSESQVQQFVKGNAAIQLEISKALEQSVAQITSTQELKTEALADYLHSRSNLQKFFARAELKTPATDPKSGANVYIVQIEDNPIAVLKVFPGTFIEGVRELAASSLVNSVYPEARPPLIYEMAKISEKGGQSRAVMLMEYIPRWDMAQKVHEIGLTLNRLRKEESPSHKEAMNVQRDLAAYLAYIGYYIKGFHESIPGKAAVDIEYKKYEVKALEDFIQNLHELVDAGILNPHDSIKLKDSLKKISQEYLELTNTPGSIAHGDGHPGNIVLNNTPIEIRMIDLETMLWSVDVENGKYFGKADPFNDVGRFVGGLESYGIQANLDIREIWALQEQFIGFYLTKTSVPFTEAMTAINFYHARYISIACRDRSLPQKICRTLLSNLIVKLN